MDVLCLSKDLIPDLKIHSNVKISINCNINQKNSNNLNYIIKTTAFVKEIYSTADGEKILLRFKLNKQDYEILDSYISFRIKEIIMELKDITY